MCHRLKGRAIRRVIINHQSNKQSLRRPFIQVDQPGSIHQRLCSMCQCCHHGWLSKTDTMAKCHSREPINQMDSTGQTGQPTFAACTASKGTLDTCENASHYYAQIAHHSHHFRIPQQPLEGSGRNWL
ncbi:hypothetical protein Lal_00012440 [Lupinus albus]|nr:hypothetical protein Lal_00012440 [Lupinus albus]